MFNTKKNIQYLNFAFNFFRFNNWYEISKNMIIGKKPDMVVLRNGIRIYFPEGISILWLVNEIFFQKVYTPKGFEIGPNDLVVDIGAHIGIFSLFAANITKNSVYAFEPFPNNIEFLKLNVKKNDFGNVIINNMAVTDKVGYSKLFLADGFTRHLVFNKDVNEKDLEEYCIVPSVTLKKIIDDNKLKQIDFLKLDCEGAEGLILMSTPWEYLKKIRKISLEFHDNVSPLNHNEIQMLLNEAGFTTKLDWDGKSHLGCIYSHR